MARDTDTDTAAETDADTAAGTDTATATDSVSVMALTLTTAGLDNDDVASLLQLVGNSAPRLQREPQQQRQPPVNGSGAIRNERCLNI